MEKTACLTQEISRETQRQQEMKTRTLGKFYPLTPTASANSKQSLTPTQINIKPHTKDIFTSVPFTQYKMFRFQQENYKVH